LGGFFEELVATISDCKFSPNGHFLLSRDYLSMKVWDLRKGNEPIQRIKFNEHLIPKLCDLYESDNIFDKFGCCWSGNSMYISPIFALTLLGKLCPDPTTETSTLAMLSNPIT
jgi:serine/threonine-protein phosphatase 2A regulatory subunit B